MEKSTEFDLLKGENDLFYVAFDILTPRPHFLIVPHKKIEIDLDFGKMTTEQAQKLMKAVDSTMSNYKITNNGILSFHRGSWFSKTYESPTFHAHICVDVSHYSSIFMQKRNQITSKFWSWKVKPENYLDLVGKSLEKSYLKEDVAAIEKLPVDLPNFEWPSVDQEGIRKVLHPSHPKIGFVGNRGKISREKLVKVIDNFAKKLGLTNMDAIGDDNGCHVCLYLVPPEEGWELKSETEEEVLGFIVTSGPRFYQFCPEDRRKDWFSAFEKSKFACLT